MPVNDKILFSDFNVLRDTIADILGTGAGTFGYGQSVRSAKVSGASGAGAVSGGGTGANVVRTDEYSKLRSDIINVYRHIYGTDPTPADPVIGQLIRWVTAAGATTSEYGLSEYGIAEFNATSIANATDPYTQYNVFVSDLTAARFTCATNQSLTESKGSVIRTGSWGVNLNTISTRVSVSFSSANAARFFFNSGGEIRIVSARSGGATTSQNTSWSSTLNSAGSRTFSAQQPAALLTGTAGNNWYTLTNTYQTWFSQNSSSPYGSNQYRIMARTLNGSVTNNNSGTSSGVDLLVVFQDNYTDPHPFPDPTDVVDGNLTVAVTVKRATGTLVPEPTAGNFTIESPTVSYFGGGTGAANLID